MNHVGLSHHLWYVVSRRNHRCLLTMGFEPPWDFFLQLNECNKHNQVADQRLGTTHRYLKYFHEEICAKISIQKPENIGGNS